jgi:hypothetical protein
MVFECVFYSKDNLDVSIVNNIFTKMNCHCSVKRITYSNDECIDGTSIYLLTTTSS